MTNNILNNTQPSVSLTKQTHLLLKPLLNPGDIAIDATCGNGHDTLFLAQNIAPSGHVYSFDIQQTAIDASSKRIQQAGFEANVTLFHAGHQFMREHIPKKHHGHIKAVMFNLGYLPRSDKKIITRSETTLTALNAALSLLVDSGILTILAYPGHNGGDEETLAVENWCNTVNNDFEIEIINSPNHHSESPRLFVIRRTP